MARAAVALLLSAVGFAPAPAFAAGCGQFFTYRRQVAYVQPVQAYYQPTYYAQAFVQPQVYYRAGLDIEAEALAEKVARKVTERLQAAQITQQVAAPAGVFQNCTKCHGPDSSLNLVDGIVTAENFARWGQIAGLGIDVPKPMQTLIAGMKPEQKGAIADELLKLWARPANQPPPPPVPDDGGLE